MKKLIIGVCYIIVGLSFPRFVSAHFLHANDGLSLSLHIEPDDNPAAREKTTLSLDFADKNHQFQLEKCDCWVYISSTDKMVDTQLIEKISGTEMNQLGRAWVTFPQTGTYQIRVVGQPVIQDEFMAFDFQYDIRVERENQLPLQVAQTAQVKKLNVPLVYGMAISFMIAFSLIYIYFHFLPKSSARKGI